MNIEDKKGLRQVKQITNDNYLDIMMEKAKVIWNKIIETKNIKDILNPKVIELSLMGPQIMPVRHLKIPTFKNTWNTLKDKDFIISLEAIDILCDKNQSEVIFRKMSFVSKFHLFYFWKYFNDDEDKIINTFLDPYNEDKNGISKNYYTDYSIFKEKYPDYSIFKEKIINPKYLIELKSLLVPTITKKNQDRTWTKKKLEEFHISMKYNEKIHIDVLNFYNSIYTHSFGWIPIIFDNKSDYDKETMKQFDSFLTLLNGNMTNGINTGSIMSKISSEILMVSISKEIIREIKGLGIEFHVYRFADDFTIYYDDKKDFLKILSIFKNTFNKYKLSINEQKFLKDNKNIKETNWNSTFENYFHSVNMSDDTIIEKKKKNMDYLKEKVNEFNEISDSKRQISYLKYFLKIHYKSNIFYDIITDEYFTKLICDFILKFIRLDDLNLNIPFTFLEDLISFFKIWKEEKEWEIQNRLNQLISEKIENIFHETKETLFKIYKNTNSEMKKVFIFDFLYTNNINEYYKKFKDYYNSGKNINKKFIFHISQLLEAKIIYFNDENINEIANEINYSYNRLSKEWIIWLYCEDKNLLEKKLKNIITGQKSGSRIKKALILLLDEKCEMKPFFYNSNELDELKNNNKGLTNSENIILKEASNE